MLSKEFTPLRYKNTPLFTVRLGMHPGLLAGGLIVAAGAAWVGLHTGGHPDTQTVSFPAANANSSAAAAIPDTFRPGTTTPLHNDSQSGMELVAPDGTTFNRTGPASWNSTHKQTPLTFPNDVAVPNPLAPGTCEIEGAGAGSSLNKAKLICSLPPAATRADIRVTFSQKPERVVLASKVRMDATPRTSFHTRRT